MDSVYFYHINDIIYQEWYCWSFLEYVWIRRKMLMILKLWTIIFGDSLNLFNSYLTRVKKIMARPGIEPRAFCLQSGHYQLSYQATVNLPMDLSPYTCQLISLCQVTFMITVLGVQVSEPQTCRLINYVQIYSKAFVFQLSNFIFTFSYTSPDASRMWTEKFSGGLVLAQNIFLFLLVLYFCR